MWKFLIFFSLLLVGIFCESEHYEDNEGSPINYSAEPEQQPEPPVQQRLRQCPTGWKYIPEFSKCLFQTPPLKWHEAEKFCVDRGAHLMSINGKDAIKPASDMVGNWFWIGLYKAYAAQEMKWRFTDNETIDYIPWTHPLSDSSLYTCASALNNVVTQDYVCDSLFAGVCQLNVFP